MIKDKYNKPVLEALSEELGISIDELEKVHDSAFKFARETIKAIPFKDMTLEEFHNTKKTFNIPGLCKLYPSEALFKRINNIDNGKKKESK